MTQTTKTFGPYDSKKQAMRSNCVMSMAGGFADGRILTVDGELMVSTAVRPAYRADTSCWIAEVDLRPATKQERAAVEIARLRDEYAGAIQMVNYNGGWASKDPQAIEAQNKARALSRQLTEKEKEGEAEQEGELR